MPNLKSRRRPRGPFLMPHQGVPENKFSESLLSPLIFFGSFDLVVIRTFLDLLTQLIFVKTCFKLALPLISIFLHKGICRLRHCNEILVVNWASSIFTNIRSVSSNR